MKLRQIRSFVQSHLPYSLAIKPYDPARSLGFMHIPKTSGTAVTHSLADATGSQRWIYGFDHVLFGGFDGYDSIDPTIRSHIYADPTTLPKDVDFVSGHLALSTLTTRYPTTQLVTFLREPNSRILSLWLYCRAFTDEQLRGWGDWQRYLHKAREPLAQFLSFRALGCQVDNIYVRMLLCPHPFIPQNDFIDPRHDEILLRDAFRRLKLFAYTDVIENPDFEANLRAWLGAPFNYARVNETNFMPGALKAPLHNELTSEALDLLDARGRLDLCLWNELAHQRVTQVTPQGLRAQTLTRTVARHSWLIAC